MCWALQVELENWVEPGKPLTAAEKAHAFVVEAGLLEAHPRSGHLPAGQCTQASWLAIRQICNSFVAWYHSSLVVKP
jgi:hypothetical protein